MVHVSFFCIVFVQQFVCVFSHNKVYCTFDARQEKMVSDGSRCQAEAVPNYDVRNVLRVWNAS